MIIKYFELNDYDLALRIRDDEKKHPETIGQNKYWVLRGLGYKASKERFKTIIKNRNLSKTIIYTNDENVIELGQKYCWNENKEKFNIYINDTGVDKLTNMQIKFDHNLLNMYKNGEIYEKSKIDK